VLSWPGAAGRDGSASPPDRPGRPCGFPRSCRLTSRREFRAVYDNGRRVSCACLTMFALASGLEQSRIGLTVTRKIGGAVQRNRVKRRLRDIFRRNRARLVPALDLVINVHRPILESSTADLERQFLSCFGRLGRPARAARPEGPRPRRRESS